MLALNTLALCRLVHRVFLFGVVLAMLVCSPLTAQTVTPVIVWQQPDSILFPTPLSSVQLNPVALRAAPVPVPLASFYNVTGITTDGVSFTSGGFDGGGRAYSASSLGSSIQWRGFSFPLGPADAPDATYGTTVPLPAGQFASLYLLGALVNNIQSPTGTLLIAYTDGSTDTVVQSMSDWTFPRDFPREFLVKCDATHNNYDGQKYNSPVCVYGYTVPLNPTKTVQSITLPNKRELLFLSMVLVPPTVDGTFTFNPPAGTVLYPGTSVLAASFLPVDLTAFTSASATVSLNVTAPPAPVPSTVSWPSPAPIPEQTPLGPTQLDATANIALNTVAVPLSPYFTQEAFYPDGDSYQVDGFNGDAQDNSYSSNQIGPVVSFGGFLFPLGVPATQNAVTQVTIPLPAGSFSALYLIGTSDYAPQPAQPFLVTYTDGSTSTTLLDISPWRTPQGYADETIVAQSSHANTPAGTQIPGTVSMYGYHIALDPTRTAQSLTMPNNNQVFLFAAGLGSGATTSVSGNFVYTPPAGTILPFGTHVLNTSFTPDYPTLILPSTGSTSIVVQKTLFVIANNATRLYGVANPPFTGSYTGAYPGDQFTLSFTSPATILSPAGQYPIVPSIAGSNLAAYAQSVQNGTLSVTPAPVTLSTPVTSGITQNQPYNFLVSVQSTTTGTPTGTVTLRANGVVLASVPVVAGLASLSASLAAGPNQVTLLYSGDNNFQPATLVINPVVAVVPLDFVLAPLHGSDLTLTLGQNGSFDFSITPLAGSYASPIHFSLAGALPPLATASFSPSQLATNAGPAAIRLTVGTRLLQGSLLQPVFPAGTPLNSAVLGPSLALVLLSLAGRRRTRKLRLLCLPLLAAMLLAGLAGCGSGYRDKTYPITITATDGTTTHTLSLNLNILAPH